MDGIMWTESQSVGVEVLDEQHRELVSITNKLFQAIMDDKGPEILLGVLKEVAGYAEYHFDYEENLLREYGFPEDAFDAHVQEHDLLKRQVGDFIARYEREHQTLDIDVFGFLRDWTSNHLSGTDKQYASFFKVAGL